MLLISHLKKGVNWFFLVACRIKDEERLEREGQIRRHYGDFGSRGEEVEDKEVEKEICEEVEKVTISDYLFEN